jgi:hypothetical protein
VTIRSNFVSLFPFHLPQPSSLAMATDRMSSNQHDHEEKASSIRSTNDGAHVDGSVVPEKSRGVLKMESLSQRINTKYLAMLYGSFALLAYVMSLGGPFPQRMLWPFVDTCVPTSPLCCSDQ